MGSHDSIGVMAAVFAIIEINDFKMLQNRKQLFLIVIIFHTLFTCGIFVKSFVIVQSQCSLHFVSSIAIAAVLKSMGGNDSVWIYHTFTSEIFTFDNFSKCKFDSTSFF